jgi:hypothetical protein
MPVRRPCLNGLIERARARHVYAITDRDLRLAANLTRMHRRLRCSGLAGHGAAAPLRRHLAPFTSAVVHNIRNTG